MKATYAQEPDINDSTTPEHPEEGKNAQALYQTPS